MVGGVDSSGDIYRLSLRHHRQGEDPLLVDMHGTHIDVGNLCTGYRVSDSFLSNQ